MVGGRTGHSRDRAWWFDGRRWLPAVTRDGRWWFDGRRWRPNRRRAALPVLVVGAASACLWPVAVMVLYLQIASHPEHPGQGHAAWVVVLHELIWWWPLLSLAAMVVGAVLVGRGIAGPVHLVGPPGAQATP